MLWSSVTERNTFHRHHKYNAEKRTINCKCLKLLFLFSLFCSFFMFMFLFLFLSKRWVESNASTDLYLLFFSFFCIYVSSSVYGSHLWPQCMANVLFNYSWLLLESHMLDAAQKRWHFSTYGLFLLDYMAVGLLRCSDGLVICLH